MASSAKDIQLRELKDTVSQLKTMISEQTELIRSLRLCLLYNKIPQSCRGDSSKLQREFPQ